MIKFILILILIFTMATKERRGCGRSGGDVGGAEGMWEERRGCWKSGLLQCLVVEEAVLQEPKASITLGNETTWELSARRRPADSYV